MDEIAEWTATLEKVYKLKRKASFFSVGMWVMFGCILFSTGAVSWIFLTLQVICSSVSIYYIKKATKTLKEAS